MEIQPIFYKRVVPLKADQHINLHLDVIEGYAFARETNSIYIASIEFPMASREYPIVFCKGADESVFPIAVLGFRDKENLYIDEQGRWQADYKPAYVRRYPFILATTNSTGPANYTVCIDESYPGFNTVKEGQRLFTKTGNHSDILKQAIEFLKEFQKHVQLTTLFCESLVKLDLLEPKQINIKLESGVNHSLGGFFAVSRERMKALDRDTLAEMLKTDQLELIYMHLASMDNMNKLLNRMK